jgi:hypothetical protein
VVVVVVVVVERCSVANWSVAVVKAQGQFGNQEEEKRPLLEACQKMMTEDNSGVCNSNL